MAPKSIHTHRRLPSVDATSCHSLQYVGTNERTRPTRVERLTHDMRKAERSTALAGVHWKIWGVTRLETKQSESLKASLMAFQVSRFFHDFTTTIATVATSPNNTKYGAYTVSVLTGSMTPPTGLGFIEAIPHSENLNAAIRVLQPT